MTCIVAIKNDKGVIMGADSCAGCAHRANSVKTPKVKRVGEFLIGYTSSFRMGQILHEQLLLESYNEKKDLFHYIVNNTIPSIRNAMRNGGFLKTDDDGRESGGEFLLAHGKRIFVVQSDFSVLEYEDDFIATGCGEEWAIGVIYALKKKKAKVTDREILECSLEAATKYSSYVRPPFNFVQNY